MWAYRISQRARSVSLSGRCLSARVAAPVPRVDGQSKDLWLCAGLCTAAGVSVALTQGSVLAKEKSVSAAPPSTVRVEPDADAVTMKLCQQVAESAEQAIAERGAFALAIPGGSILKMLSTGSKEGGPLAKVDWSKCTLAYVNHKCVADDHADSTHLKAAKGFLGKWKGVTVATVAGSNDGVAEAMGYEEKMRALPTTALPRNADGVPVFDLILLGVGDDGHFGSLNPGRDEISDKSGRWILPVDLKSPPSITMSPSVILASRKILIPISGGVSEKSPKGKSAAVKVAIQGEVSPREFPASVLRGKATWLLDAAAASDLSPEYRA